MPEIDMNNLPCPFCGRRYEFVMVVYGPWPEDTVDQMAMASVDWVECVCGAAYSRESGWERKAEPKKKQGK